MTGTSYNQSKRQLYATISKRLSELQDELDELDPENESIHETWRRDRTLFISVEHIEIYPEAERPAFVSFLASIPDDAKELRHDVREGDILVLFYEKLSPETIAELKRWAEKEEKIREEKANTP